AEHCRWRLATGSEAAARRHSDGSIYGVELQYERANCSSKGFELVGCEVRDLRDARVANAQQCQSECLVFTGTGEANIRGNPRLAVGPPFHQAHVDRLRAVQRWSPHIDDCGSARVAERIRILVAAGARLVG